MGSSLEKAEHNNRMIIKLIGTDIYSTKYSRLMERGVNMPLCMRERVPRPYIYII